MVMTKLGYDPYRDALVVEEETIWPENLLELDEKNRQVLERVLHSHPEMVENLEYVKLPTGFCRRITVTREDLSHVLKLAENGEKFGADLPAAATLRNFLGKPDSSS